MNHDPYPDYPKYPRQPVLRCEGHQPRESPTKRGAAKRDLTDHASPF